MLTIVIATWNASRTIVPCLNSIPDHSEFEVVVVDGDSSDSTVDLAKAQRRQNLKIISEPDRGIYDAWNKGIDASQGRVIAFLGADDRLGDSHRIAREAESKDVNYTYGSNVRFTLGANNEPEKLSLEGSPWPAIEKSFWRGGMQIPHPGSLHSRNLFENFGKFDPRWKSAGDFEFLVRVIGDGQVTPVYNPFLITALVGHGGVSTQNKLRSFSETSEVLAMHGRPLTKRHDLSQKIKYYAGDKLRGLGMRS